MEDNKRQEIVEQINKLMAEGNLMFRVVHQVVVEPKPNQISETTSTTPPEETTEPEGTE